MMNKSHRHVIVFRKFLDFWNKKIVQDPNEEIEISELFYIFKKYSGIKTTNERELLKLIKHQFPYISIVNNKTIYGFKCLDWDKRNSIKDVVNSLAFEKEIGKIELYKKYREKVKKNMVVSKTYFINNIDSILNEVN